MHALHGLLAIYNQFTTTQSGLRLKTLALTTKLEKVTDPYCMCGWRFDDAI